MTYLFCNIKRCRAIRMLPFASKYFPQYWIIRLLQPFRFFVETTKIEFNYFRHPLQRIILCCGRFKKINVIVEIGKFFEERPWLKNECWQCHLREIHPWTNLLQQTPHQTLILVAHIFRLCAINQRTKLFRLRGKI
uniref:Uncharacterized protein n=1 Tax=Parascaris equorum TaxID=6256 RepID=A0A914RH79_PAREQ